MNHGPSSNSQILQVVLNLLTETTRPSLAAYLYCGYNPHQTHPILTL